MIKNIIQRLFYNKFFIVKYKSNRFVNPYKFREQFVRARDESEAAHRFINAHNVFGEGIEVLGIREVDVL